MTGEPDTTVSGLDLERATAADDAAAPLSALADDPRYRDLIARRSRLAWCLTGLMLIIYFGFILLVAFRPDFLASPLGAGVTSVGIPVGLGVILAGILLTAVYVRRANRSFDPVMDELRREFAA